MSGWRTMDHRVEGLSTPFSDPAVCPKVCQHPLACFICKGNKTTNHPSEGDLKAK